MALVRIHWKARSRQAIQPLSAGSSTVTKHHSWRRSITATRVPLVRTRKILVSVLGPSRSRTRASATLAKTGFCSRGLAPCAMHWGTGAPPKCSPMRSPGQAAWQPHPEPGRKPARRALHPERLLPEPHRPPPQAPSPSGGQAAPPPGGGTRKENGKTAGARNSAGRPLPTAAAGPKTLVPPARGSVPRPPYLAPRRGPGGCGSTGRRRHRRETPSPRKGSWQST